MRPLLSTVPTYFPSSYRSNLEYYRRAKLGYILRQPDDMATASAGLWYYYFDRDSQGVYAGTQ